VTSKAHSGNRILGSLRSADGKGVVRIEDSFDTGIDDLWSALIDPERLARWYGEVEGELRLGGEFRARAFASESDGTGRVDVCEPPQRLLVTMDPGQPNEQVLEATLTANGDQTVLVVEKRGMLLAHLAAYGSGWQIHLENLADYLAGLGRRDAEARWDELLPAYEDLAADVNQ